jgi:hypothetical protein
VEIRQGIVCVVHQALERGVLVGGEQRGHRARHQGSIKKLRPERYSGELRLKKFCECFS